MFRQVPSNLSNTRGCTGVAEVLAFSIVVASLLLQANRQGVMKSINNRMPKCGDGHFTFYYSISDDTVIIILWLKIDYPKALSLPYSGKVIVASILYLISSL
jgi:hypothetical protein